MDDEEFGMILFLFLKLRKKYIQNEKRTKVLDKKIIMIIIIIFIIFLVRI